MRSAREALLALVLCILAAPAGAAEAQARPPLILGVHPYLPPREVVERFTPLADYLGRELGRRVEVRVGRDYDEHITAIARGAIDIAYLGPAAYVKLEARHGRRPLLARIEVDGRPELHGVIVTAERSDVRTLADLKGRRFAYGDPDSTMSHLVPLYMLINAGVPERALAGHKFLGAHKNVVLAVLAGDFDAGAVKYEVYEEYAGQGLRRLATSPAVSEHLFVASARLPATEVQRLRRALLAVGGQPGGPAVMQAIHKGMTGLVPVRDADYDSLRTILRTVEHGPR